MLFPLIKIREKVGDKEYTHIVGTNSHDELIIQNNAIQNQKEGKQNGMCKL